MTIPNGSAVLFLRGSDPMFSRLPPSLLQGIEEATAMRGLVLVDVTLSKEEMLDINSVIKVLSQHQPQAFIINLHYQIPKPLIFLMNSLSIPRVWINVKREHLCVRPDDFEGTRNLVKHLVGLGHRRIVYINRHSFAIHGRRIHYSVFDRCDGYSQGMKDAGLKPQVAWLDPDSAADLGSIVGGEAGSRPTAVMLYAAEPGITDGIRALGLRIPQDISVACVGDVGDPIGSDGLDYTSMCIDWHGLGMTVVNLLEDQHGIFDPLPSRVLPLRLSPGNSACEVPVPPAPA